jgi:hypothetical protein
VRRALRWLLDLDRSYFLALSAFVFALAASIFLLAVPVYTGTNEDGTRFSGTLIEVDGARVIGLLIVPILVTSAPLLVLPRKKSPLRRSHKVNAVATTAMLLVFVGITIVTLGVLYLPSLILSTASSASLFFGRDRKPGALSTAAQGKRGRAERRKPQRAQQGEKIRMSGKRRRKGAR